MKRLNKHITDMGYCSRREADRYIAEGRVSVNGRQAVLGQMIDQGDCVEVDGEKVGAKAKKTVYIACNKPAGVTCTTNPADKTNIVDFIGYKERIFPVGRLDKDSEGLIILTNDGDIVNKILRAGNNNPKEYIVTVDRPLTPEFLKHMAEGVRIMGVVTKPCRIVQKKSATFVIYLTQGLNRQIRRMCEALGYRVKQLKRVKVINISLGNLEPGRWRYFTAEEEREMHSILALCTGTEEASTGKRAAAGRRGQGARAQGGRAKGGSSQGERGQGALAQSGAKSGRAHGSRSQGGADKAPTPYEKYRQRGKTKNRGGTPR